MLTIIYHWGYYFFIYAFLGWCVEVIYTAFTRKTFINRGFLNGPICPIYGVGVCAVILCLTPIKQHFFLLYICAVLLTTTLEFITGYLLEHFFNEKWWDYSKVSMNIMGFICVPASLLWGVGCVFVIYAIHTVVPWMVSALPLAVGWFLLVSLVSIFLTDFCMTLIGILKFKKTIAVLNKIEGMIRNMSDSIGENLSDTVLNAMMVKKKSTQKLNAINSKYRDQLDEKGIHTLDELKAKYNELISRREIRLGKRLSHAFPRLKNHHIFSVLESHLQNRKKR